MQLRVVALRLLLCATPLCANLNAQSKPAAVIPLEPYLAEQFTIHARVNGKDGVFLFDTGEGVTTISPEFARAIDCTPWGNITGFRMRGERLDFPRCDDLAFEAAGQRFSAPIAGVFDIMSLVGPDVPKVDGAIGLDLFAGRAITIEPVARRLVIESRESLAERVKHASEIPIRLVREAEGLSLTVVAGVKTPRGLAWMELDTGNGGTLTIAQHIAPLIGLDPAKKEPQPVRCDLAPEVALQGNARAVDRMIMDGNISNQSLRHWNLTLDLKNGRAWLAPAER